ncbi:MAG: CDP-alcohol phosphatidyltransferase family protein [Candidatus Magasanikbacteria bacterium]|nr:CDP-alcohol phosphatidyltransferase family protein [Candidatus Magasanikbacteria bacterium]
MSFISDFKSRHPDLFTYKTGLEVHPHDHLMARTVLKLFPSTVTPNQVTMFRVLATPIVFLLILNDFYAVGIIAFLLVAFTDAIDGSLARTRGKISNFGILFDPLADKLLIGSMVLLVVFQNFSFYLGITVLALEIIFILSAFVAKYKFKTVKAANIWGKIKMILQVFAVFLTLAGLLLNFQYFFTLAAWLFGLAIGFAIVSLFAHGV